MVATIPMDFGLVELLVHTRAYAEYLGNEEDFEKVSIKVIQRYLVFIET